MVRVVNLSLEISILHKICLSLICKMWLTETCVKNDSNSWQKPLELKNNAFFLQMSAIYLLGTVLGSEIRNLREMWILFPLPELQLAEYFQMDWELQTCSTYFTKMGSASSKWPYYILHLTRTFQCETI